MSDQHFSLSKASATHKQGGKENGGTIRMALLSHSLTAASDSALSPRRSALPLPPPPRPVSSSNKNLPVSLTLEHVSPVTRLLEKRKQMLQVQESLDSQKVGRTQTHSQRSARRPSSHADAQRFARHLVRTRPVTARA